ncbi:uncharacterized protein K460DRAFT_369338 [Cucurbitaria berberidis CBS 394.84]|uniref:F-box domain-containing protein n=1 Tax=Cucurbitaria berberidis CBS 394.84 TaxID=1168544 RepID=A0A9P4L3T7_9PLEO|nr:uncharacterized protein K460DRAFT_369338 [Cucurbitaria berberidis CBS 394.84]KAF1841296.1 hypothetical protein K460DRAFT_369338 [Cucurbitaria berberidis CBS 394.84]
MTLFVRQPATVASFVTYSLIVYLVLSVTTHLPTGNMVQISWDQELQGLGNGFPVDGGRAIYDFEEYTFRAPRPGFFLGDSLAPSGGLNPVILSEQENVDEKIPLCPSSRPYLGQLDILATELLHQVFVHLDVCSILSFRRVNQDAKAMVNSFLPFRSIATFPKLLGAVDALQCRFWTLETLVRCVFDERCSRCGRFGDIMYLVTPERWCYRCWIRDEELVVQRVPSSMTSHEEVVQTCQNVPNVRLSEGYYGLKANGILSRPMLAFDLRKLRHTLPTASNWERSSVRNGHPLCYTAVIRAPYWDAQAARFEEGYFCRACASQGWTHRSRQGLVLFHCLEFPVWGSPWRRYTREGMRAHIDRYGTIFKIQTPFEESRYVHEKPFTEFVWEDPDELRGIGPLLQRCREKEIQLVQGQPFLSGWDTVSSNLEIKE